MKSNQDMYKKYTFISEPHVGKRLKIGENINPANRVIAIKNNIPSVKSSGLKINKDTDEIISVRYVSRELANEITIARTNKKLSRVQLAAKLNMDVGIIAAIESGKNTIYNGKHIGNIKRELGIKKIDL